ncbi:MAG TPA: RNA-binding cell elongation regulator Jag/EloR [Bacilli bacterium]|nr:RNA-binding cell elongation regulator Jag/EloR [Bacilli bacterium]
MRIYEAKTLEDVLKTASEELGINVENLAYEVVEEKRGLFSKHVIVNVFETTDFIEYATEYLELIIKELGLEPKITPHLDGEIIKLNMDTNHNSILIGKNGKTLQALNELVTLAVSIKYKKRIRVFLDINDYKSDRYRRVIGIARRIANEVGRTKQTVVLDPMPSDERRAIHNALSNHRHVITESIGTGRERKIVIKHKRTPQPIPEDALPDSE